MARVKGHLRTKKRYQAGVSRRQLLTGAQEEAKRRVEEAIRCFCPKRGSQIEKFHTLYMGCCSAISVVSSLALPIL